MSARFISIILADQGGLKVVNITLFFFQKGKKNVGTCGTISPYGKTSLYDYIHYLLSSIFLKILSKMHWLST